MSQTLPTHFHVFPTSVLTQTPEKQNTLGMLPKQKKDKLLWRLGGKFGPTLGTPTAGAGALAITGTSGFLQSWWVQGVFFGTSGLSRSSHVQGGFPSPLSKLRPWQGGESIIMASLGGLSRSKPWVIFMRHRLHLGLSQYLPNI